MPIKVNEAAIAHARQMVSEGRYRINSVWRDNQPTADSAAAYAAKHGADEAARWYLAFNPDMPSESPDRLLYPVGDFSNVHESGLRAARERAEVEGQAEIAAAAEDILEIFYRMNAC
ncbi:MAG: hypothetical protein JNL42_18360 [Anaerolineae bacterium]|nr:hypothetical protein [Anaerolineae bacterium]